MVMTIPTEIQLKLNKLIIKFKSGMINKNEFLGNLLDIGACAKDDGWMLPEDASQMIADTWSRLQ